MKRESNERFQCREIINLEQEESCWKQFGTKKFLVSDVMRLTFWVKCEDNQSWWILKFFMSFLCWFPLHNHPQSDLPSSRCNIICYNVFGKGNCILKDFSKWLTSTNISSLEMRAVRDLSISKQDKNSSANSKKKIAGASFTWWLFYWDGLWWYLSEGFLWKFLMKSFSLILRFAPTKAINPSKE